MKAWHCAALVVGLVLPGSDADKPIDKKNGIISIRSNHSVDETVERLKSLLRTKDVTLFTVIDHSGEAQKLGVKLPAWVARHGAARSSAAVSNSFRAFRIILTNAVKYVTNVDMLRHLLRFGLESVKSRGYVR